MAVYETNVIFLLLLLFFASNLSFRFIESLFNTASTAIITYFMVMDRHAFFFFFFLP